MMSLPEVKICLCLSLTFCFWTYKPGGTCLHLPPVFLQGGGMEEAALVAYKSLFISQYRVTRFPFWYSTEAAPWFWEEEFKQGSMSFITS